MKKFTHMLRQSGNYYGQYYAVQAIGDDESGLMRYGGGGGGDRRRMNRGDRRRISRSRWRMTLRTRSRPTWWTACRASTSAMALDPAWDVDACARATGSPRVDGVSGGGAGG